MNLKITKQAVDKMAPRTVDTFLWDTEVKGFGLKLTPSGRRVYLLQKRLGGRLKRWTIGTHGSPWTPETARREAIKLLGQVAGGHDPSESKRASAAVVLNVSTLCDLYLAEGVATKKASTVATDKGRIARHIKPLLGSRLLKAVTRQDVERFMVDVAGGRTAADEKTGKRGRAIVKGGRGTATRTVGLLGAIFQFAVQRGLMSQNPARGVRRFKDRRNSRFLSPAEFARLGAALCAAERDGEYPYGLAAIRLLALSGCRRNEVLSLRWAWIDEENSCLRLPDSKTGSKVVPLGAAALEAIKQVPTLDDSPYVFPAVRGEGHFIGIQKVWERVRARAKLSDVRLHDLRHSFAATGASAGDSLVILGALLGHADAATTARYAHLSHDPVKSAANKISSAILEAMSSESEHATNA